MDFTKEPEYQQLIDAFQSDNPHINIDTFTYKYPAPVSKNSMYEAIENNYWTCSFWTGMLWLANEVTGDEKYRKVAEIQLKSFKQRLEAKITALAAAEELMKRYFDKAGIIQAWGNLQDPIQRGRIIIDCCMNLPLLYWASEVTGDKKIL